MMQIFKKQKYGTCWNENTNYKVMHDSKPLLNQHFAHWLLQQEAGSIVEIGCGRGEYIKYLPASSHYMGVDINGWAIAYCRANYPQYRFMAEDVNNLASKIIKQGNLTFHSEYGRLYYNTLFSHDVIDHVHDINEFIHSCLTIGKHIYISSYRGFVNTTDKHRQRWNNTDGCFYNNISEQNIRKKYPMLKIERVPNGYPYHLDNKKESDGFSMVITN